MTVPRRRWLLLVALSVVVATATPAFAASDATTGTTMPAQLQSGSSAQSGATSLLADCLGCYGEWGLWDLGSWVRGKRASYTNEFLSFIHVHWAFIMPDPDSCNNMYDGPYASAGTKELNNTSSDQVQDNNYSQGGQNAWTNAGAHQWTDDGVTWELGYDGGTDICKTF